jgi:hypothetical protein
VAKASRKETKVEYNGQLEGAVGAFRYNPHADVAAAEPEECLVGFLAREYWPVRSYFLDRCGQISILFDDHAGMWPYSNSKAGVAAFHWHDIFHLQRMETWWMARPKVTQMLSSLNRNNQQVELNS